MEDNFVYSPILQHEWRELSHKIAESLQRLGTALEKVEAVGGYGWMLPLDASPGEATAIYENIVDEGTADGAFKMYFEAYNGFHLSNLIKSLNTKSELAVWRPLIVEAVECFQAGHYRIVVSAMIPVLEGICVDKFSSTDFQSSRTRERLTNELRRWALANTSATGYLWLSAVGLLGAIYRYVPFGSLPTQFPGLVNRHVILHGRNIPDSSRLDAIRLLLALDTLSGLRYPPPTFSTNPTV